ncbi:hypothetical protein X773_09125 [Mesorhizobium sp. LSJC285A00]|nr:hypothetical protein X773_09125 [Mesorhizobium sp. LSJC285A00]ESX09125.1 hypothetical protein X768_19845 [Mesorhizobium sp. LSJC265A00]
MANGCFAPHVDRSDRLRRFLKGVITGGAPEGTMAHLAINRPAIALAASKMAFCNRSFAKMVEGTEETGAAVDAEKQSPDIRVS